MRKIVIVVVIFLLFPFSALATTKEEVTFSSCIDGDTAKFKRNNEVIKVRFLAIDTPETKHPQKGEEPYGKEASEYTCNKIKNAKKIELEFDPNSDEKDKYDRYLAWVFTDDSLLQAELVKNGLASVAYLYGDYKYTSLLQDYEETAKVNKIGIHGNIKEKKVYKQDKNKQKIQKKTKKKIKNKLSKYFDKFIDEILDEIFN